MLGWSNEILVMKLLVVGRRVRGAGGNWAVMHNHGLHKIAHNPCKDVRNIFGSLWPLLNRAIGGGSGGRDDSIRRASMFPSLSLTEPEPIPYLQVLQRCLHIIPVASLCKSFDHGSRTSGQLSLQRNLG